MRSRATTTAAISSLRASAAGIAFEMTFVASSCAAFGLEKQGDRPLPGDNCNV